MTTINDAKLCSKQEYCTDCPIRKRCPNRPAFYHLKKFINILEDSKSAFLFISTIIGDDLFSSYELANECWKTIWKKRNREVSLHPEYSEN